LQGAKVCLVQYILVTFAASLFLRPTTKNLAYVFAFLWCMCQGWMHPQHTTIFVTISPKGKGETEMMGLFLFAVLVLSFIPPLVFSMFNEMRLPVSLGVATLTMYLCWDTLY
jgi:ABC-type transport system involved in multi-copper enzyme maturation permease subunit